MDLKEYRFYSNPDDRRVSSKWVFVSIITFIVVETAFVVYFVKEGMSTWDFLIFTPVISTFISFLASIRAIFGRRLRPSAFKIRHNYHIIISDCLTQRTSKFEDRSIENDGLPNEHFLEDMDISIQWKDITSCKISKAARLMTVKDIHGKQITIGREFEDYRTIWPLIIERAEQASPDADIDNLIIEKSASTKDFV